MNTQVSVRLPANVSGEEMHLFAPFLSYELPPLRILKLADIFVTHSGFCVDESGLIEACHHAYPEQLRSYVDEAMGYYQAVTDDPGRLITLDDDRTYAVIHHPWYNYYHWLCESVFRAWMIRPYRDELTLVLPEHYRGSDFIMGSLEPFGFRNIYFIPEGKSLYVKHLWLPQLKPLVDAYDRGLLQTVRQFYVDYVTREKGMHIDLGDKLYISRKKASRKRVDNEAGIEGILRKHGFRIINNEEYTFLEQVAIYANARYLVSIHGSGLTNMLFMQPGSSILELHKKLTNSRDWHSKAFWYLADAMGYTYYQQVCDPTDENDDYFTANFIVDAVALDQNLGLMFAKPN